MNILTYDTMPSEVIGLGRTVSYLWGQLELMSGSPIRGPIVGTELGAFPYHN